MKKLFLKKKNINSLETTHLHVNEIKCPYCRKRHIGLLPYVTTCNVKKIYGVNTPHKYSMKYWECEWTYKSGAKKGKPCLKSAMHTECGNYCPAHYKNIAAKKQKKEEKTNKESVLNPIAHIFSKKYTVIECKKILRDNKLKLSGKKADLINRIFENLTIDLIIELGIVSMYISYFHDKGELTAIADNEVVSALAAEYKISGSTLDPNWISENYPKYMQAAEVILKYHKTLGSSITHKCK